MRHLKILSIAAVAIAGVLALTASALATTVTSPTGTPFTGTIKGISTGHAILDNPVAKIECTVEIEGNIESQGAGVTAKGQGAGFIVGGCTNSWHVTTVASGIVEAHHTGNYDGVITSSGATVEATRFGISCRYRTEATKIGTATAGSPPTLHIATAIPFHSGSGLCGSGATTGTGSGVGTSPSSLFLDA